MRKKVCIERGRSEAKPDSDQQQSAVSAGESQFQFRRERLPGYLLSCAKFMLGSKSNAVRAKSRQSFSMSHMVSSTIPI